MAKDVAPYLTADAGIRYSPWHAYLLGERVLIDDGVVPWDPGTDLLIARSVDVDYAEVVERCRLTHGTPLTLSVSWSSSTTSMTEQVFRNALTASQSVAINVSLAGDRIGGKLTVSTVLALATDFPDAPLGVARDAGSVLHKEEVVVQLEDGRSMFPMAVVDFARTRFDPNASWRLQTSADLEAPFMGAFLIMINSRDVALVHAIETGGRDPQGRLLLDELEASLASLLHEIALAEAEILDSREWPSDSVGEVLSSFLPRLRERNVSRVQYEAEGLADLRSRLDGIVREAGYGRIFQ